MRVKNIEIPSMRWNTKYSFSEIEKETLPKLRFKINADGGSSITIHDLYHCQKRLYYELRIIIERWGTEIEHAALEMYFSCEKWK